MILLLGRRRIDLHLQSVDLMQVEEVEEEASLEVSLDPCCLEEPEKIPGFPGPSSTCSWVNTKTVGLQVTLASMLLHLG